HPPAKSSSAYSAALSGQASASFRMARPISSRCRRLLKEPGFPLASDLPGADNPRSLRPCNPGRCLVRPVRRLVAVWALAVLAAVAPAAAAQPSPPRLYQGLRWRCIGPFRGGRTVGAAGVPGRPNLFYIGVNNGGVWKTTDYGHTWVPIFDDQP